MLLGHTRGHVLALRHELERDYWADHLGARLARERPLNEGLPYAHLVHQGAGGGAAYPIQLPDQLGIGPRERWPADW
jgi:hypothetical protein